MTREREDLARALKRIHVTCRQINHDLGWICAVLAQSDKPNRGEVARQASLQVADRLDELAQSLRMQCSIEQE